MTQIRGLGPMKRRTPGSKWFFYLDGKRVQTPYRDETAAKAWRLNFLAGESMGQRHVGAENATLNDLFDLLADDHEGTSSERSSGSRIKRLRDRLGKIRVVDVTQKQIDGYRKDRLREKRTLKNLSKIPTAPATVARELELLRRAFKLGARQTPPLVLRVPHVGMPTVQNIRTSRIAHEQYLGLIAALRSPEREAAIIAYHTGWRLGVILGLTWDRVDWANKVIRPPANQSREKRVGTAPIYGGMQDALKECMRIESDWVIHRKSGRRVVDIRKAWAKAAKAVGIAGFRFHDMRACAVSTLIDSGVSPYDAMQISGHKSMSTLQRYDIVSPKRLQGIGKLVEERLGQAENNSAVQ